jgi:hypothetical protein
MADVRRFKTSYRRFFQRRRLFDSAFYSQRYPDVGAARMHCFAHYLLHGAAEGRKPNPWFDPDYYLARSSAARQRGGDPFVDYLAHGRREGASTHPLMDGGVVRGRSRAEPVSPTEGSLFECDS